MDLLLSLFHSDAVINYLHELLHAEVLKMTVAFTVAARLHRSWVKRDMTDQFAVLTESINHVARSMGSRLDGLDERIDRIEKR